MRIRQIKPAYWLDKELRQGLTALQRELYIGLWMLADDAGWLELDVERIAAELYPYDGTRRRERFVAAALERLATLAPEDPHLVRYPCGHGQVPKLSQHQRIAGKQAFGIRDRHRSHPKVAESGYQVLTDSPGRVGNGIGTVGNVTVGKGSARDARDSQEEETTFKRGMVAAGVQAVVSGKP